MMQQTVITLSLVVLAALVGYLVRRLLALNEALKAAESQDDILGQVAGRVRGDFLSRLNLRRRAQKVREQLPDALDMIANSLTAGLTLPQALLRNLEGDRHIHVCTHIRRKTV